MCVICYCKGHNNEVCYDSGAFTIYCHTTAACLDADESTECFFPDIQIVKILINNNVIETNFVKKKYVYDITMII